MSEQIYLLEVLVNRIEFKPGLRISNIDGLSVGFKFAQIANFEVDTAFFESPEVEEVSDQQTILMRYGKTFLFVSKPSTLRQLLQTDPYVITLYDGNKTLGSTVELWKREFSEMIKFFETIGIVKSTTVENVYDLQNDQGGHMANVDMFLRMSCFGENLQTMFQIRTEGLKEEYIFRQRNASKTFKVEKHPDDRCDPLVAPLYTAITETKSRVTSQVNMKENVSLTQLFERERTGDKDSSYRPPDDQGICLDFNQDDFDKVSICFRPSENKFFDLLDLISADIKPKEKHTEVLIHRKQLNRINSFLKSVGGDLKSSPNVVVEDEEENFLEMTADKIAKRLCSNKDCPAVQKFKEYGIGPLSTGKALGTLYGDIEPPVTYGLSHTYGTMCEYGPYGVFSRPKHETLPFVPLEENIEALKKPCNMKKKNKHSRSPTWHSSTCPLCPQRLRGGADVDSDEEFIMPKSPMIECKSVMDQFDSILAEYKKAIGPCGHATCPYAQTLAEDACKKICDQPPVDNQKNSSLMSCPDSTCDLEGCPYATEAAKKKKRYPAGCGNPKCAYTKYKLGLVDDDAELELRFLPPSLVTNCGDSKCKYPLAPPLPPIHWDCPDPLPRGPCRNLNCPFQPPKLKKLKTKKQLKTGPCGSPLCPYALPQPCGVPTCPFVIQPCPMLLEAKRNGKNGKNNQCDPECGSEEEENTCKNPECPFSSANVNVNDGVEGEFQDCVNPQCPFKKPQKKKKKKKKKSNCGNPACPVSEKQSSEESTCSNQECPAQKLHSKKKNKRCSQEITNKEPDSVCSDPECPYASLNQGKKKKKNVSSSDSVSSCNKKDDQSVCSNPECPEFKARQEDLNLCDQPDCPYSKPPNSVCDDVNCPYLQALPSCGIPNCPYEPVPLRFSCKNPNCPSKHVDFGKKSRVSKTFEKTAELKNGTATSIVLETTTVCKETDPCEKDTDCLNPDCEMKESASPSVAVSSHKKRLKRKKKGKFVYSIGDTYPGTKLGHKECVTPVFNVPPHMGWLWNIFTPMLRLKPRRGWRPGALTKTIAARIRAHRQAKGLGYLRVPTFRKDGGQYDESDPKVVPKPTLQIQKKEGTYWITMNPLKDPLTLVENEDPYMECTPMTFKITKNKKADDYCYCDGGEPEAPSSSDSELDIEFTPPAGIIHPERFKKRPNVACAGAQYDITDFEVPKKKDAKKGKNAKGKKKDKKGGGKKKKK